MIAFPAVIEHDDADNVFHVRFPDLPGCLTFGDTFSEARDMAKEALTGYLQSIDARRMKIPCPSKLRGDEVFYIEPETRVAFAVWLRTQREILGLSQTDVAKKLGMKYQTYQRIENTSKSNPTLKTILRLEEVFGKKLIHV